jgi:hypothetical protein
MQIESLLDCQERGANARILGVPSNENPYSFSEAGLLSEEERRLLRDAWAFGWTIEDSVRQNDTGVYAFLRAEAALMTGDRSRP